MYKLGVFLHDAGAVLGQASKAAGPDVSAQLGTVGAALHTAADLLEQKEAVAYLGPIVGSLVASMLNALTDNAASDLGSGNAAQPNPAALPGA